MAEFLTLITRLSVLVFLLSSMTGIGLGLTLQQIAVPLRSAKFVVAAVLANFLIAPFLAIGIARILNLDEPFAIGLLLLGLGAGAPFMPKVAGLAGGDLALSVGLMVLLMAGTMLFLPVALPLAIKGADVNPWEIARFLFLLMLLPLAIGLVTRARRENFSSRLRPVLERVSTIASVVVLVLILTIHSKGVLQIFGTGAILAALLFGGLTALSGWLLGGRGRARKTALGLGTGLRNVPAALIVSVQNFKDPNVTVMVIVTTLFGIIALVPAAILIGKKAQDAGTPDNFR